MYSRTHGATKMPILADTPIIHSPIKPIVRDKTQHFKLRSEDWRAEKITRDLKDHTRMMTYITFLPFSM